MTGSFRPRDGSPDPQRLARTVAQLTGSLRPVRPLPSDRAMIALALALFVAFSLAATMPVHFIGFYRLDLTQKIVYYASVLVCALLITLMLIESMIPGAKRRVSPGVAIAGSLVLLCVVVVVLFPQFTMPSFVERGMFCLKLGLSCAAVSGLLSWTLVRKGYASSPLQMTLAASCLPGLAGFAVLALHCPIENAGHILAWHLGPAVISGAVGALLGLWKTWNPHP